MNNKFFNESIQCFNCRTAILNGDNRLLDKYINNYFFDINERFSTCEKDDENYLNYALKVGNFYAVNKLINRGGLILSSLEKQEMLNLLSLNKRYLLLIKSIKKLENKKVPIVNYISTIKNNDYNEVFKRR